MMDKFGLLKSDNTGDEQVLETDIMRFFAIIGIVFWIIFAVIKSIPFNNEKTTITSSEIQTSVQQPRKKMTQHFGEKESIESKPNTQDKNFERGSSRKIEQNPASEQKKSASEQKKSVKKLPEQKTINELPDEDSTEPPHETESLSQPDKSQEKETETFDKTEKKMTEKTQRSEPSSIKGVKVEFQSLKSIKNLAFENRLKVFGRAKSTGFDIIFQGVPTGDSFRFKSVRKIPREMWVIKDGNARQYFLKRMIKTVPAVRTFQEKTVQVVFLDKKLEERVLRKKEYLKENGKNGILTVTEEGGLVFDPNN